MSCRAERRAAPSRPASPRGPADVPVGRGAVMTHILEVEGVSKRFGHFVALNKVSARFEAKKLSAIIGPNGAGKSTFFNVVSGAFPPSSGTLKFQGQRHHRAGAARVRAHRHRQELPDHQRLPAAHRARERARRGADACFALRVAEAARGDARAGRARQQPARARGPGRPAAAPRRRPGARPAARARGGDGAGQRARAAADGRAHGRHVARGNPGDDGPHRHARRRAHGDPGGAQDEAGDGHLRALAGAAPRRVPRRGHARRTSAPTKTCGAFTWGRDDDVSLFVFGGSRTVADVRGLCRVLACRQRGGIRPPGRSDPAPGVARMQGRLHSWRAEGAGWGAERSKRRSRRPPGRRRGT